MRYTVKRVIEVEAKDPKDAAILAHRLMVHSERLRRIFHVKPAGTRGAPKVIEL